MIGRIITAIILTLVFFVFLGLAPVVAVTFTFWTIASAMIYFITVILHYQYDSAKRYAQIMFQVTWSFHFVTLPLFWFIIYPIIYDEDGVTSSAGFVFL